MNEFIDAIPQTLGTGGLESMAAACIKRGSHIHRLDDVALAVCLSGCIDAPITMPAGGSISPRHQIFVRRP